MKGVDFQLTCQIGSRKGHGPWANSVPQLWTDRGAIQADIWLTGQWPCSHQLASVYLLRTVYIVAQLYHLKVKTDKLRNVRKKSSTICKGLFHNIFYKQQESQLFEPYLAHVSGDQAITYFNIAITLKIRVLRSLRFLKIPKSF